MKVFVAGGSGAVGRYLVPKLVQRGHRVFATTRSPANAQAIMALGAEPVILDALDRDAVMRALMGTRPGVVVHELTSLRSFVGLRRFDQAFAMTNRLRTESTRHLVDAARSAGTRLFVAQSYAGWPYRREGGPVKTEDDPLDPDPLPAMRRSLEAIRSLEEITLGALGPWGVVLRYGSFYGPGTSLGPGGAHLEAVRRRRLPLVGDGAGIWSFIHVDDAASATVAAIEGRKPGRYNVVDDDPAPVRDWLPYLAATIGAKPPLRVPAWLARVFIGQQGIIMMTQIRGASNAKAKRDLDWTPRFPSWIQGFATGLDVGHDSNVAGRADRPC